MFWVKHRHVLGKTSPRFKNKLSEFNPIINSTTKVKLKFWHLENDLAKLKSDIVSTDLV